MAVVTGCKRLLPYGAAGHTVDTFIILVSYNNASSQLDIDAIRRVQAVIQQSVSGVPHAPCELTAHQCNPVNTSYRPIAESNAVDCNTSVLPSGAETRAAPQFKYDWIYRTRTDIVLLADTPLRRWSRPIRLLTASTRQSLG